MDKHVSLSVLVSVGLLFATATALAGNPPHPASVDSPAHPDFKCATCGPRDPGGGDSPPPMKVSYVHKDPTAKTITIQLSNGLTSVVDFGSGVITLDYGGTHTSKPLDTVISEFVGGDPGQAASFYSEMYGSLTAPHTGSILSDVPSNNFGMPHTNLQSGPWSQPKGCMSSWVSCADTIWYDHSGGGGGGAYYNHRDSTLGDGGPSGGCAPWDGACRAWKQRQQLACNRFGQNMAGAGLGVVGFLGGCSLGGEISLGALCYAGVLGASAGLSTLIDDHHTCHTPYGG